MSVILWTCCLLVSVRNTVTVFEGINSYNSRDVNDAPLLVSVDHEGSFRVQTRSHSGPQAANLLREQPRHHVLSPQEGHENAQITASVDRDGGVRVAHLGPAAASLIRDKEKVKNHQEMLSKVQKLHVNGTSGQSDRTSLARTESAKVSEASHLGGTSNSFGQSWCWAVVGVIIGFLAGVCCMICCVNMHVKRNSQTSNHLLENQQEEKEYAFQCMDSEDNKTRNWRWCKESRVQDLGVLTNAPTRPFEDFSRIDVDEAEEKLVMNVLSRSNVDFTQFNVKRHMEELLLKLEEGECFFMATEDGSRVLLMIESVRIRCMHDGYVLIREPDNSFLAKSLALPSVEKPTAEAPAAAARRLWSSVLKMPDDSAQFIEDGIEDKEVVGGYNGIRCIERCHIMAVRFEGISEEQLNQLGLPSHTSFITPLSAYEASQAFSWKRRDECGSIGVKRESNDHLESLNIRRFDMANSSEFQHLLRIKDFLRSGGIAFEKWDEGEGGKSKLRRLSDEVRAGTCVLEKTDSGVQRCVNILLVRLWSPDETLLLCESERVAEDVDLELPHVNKDAFENLTSAAVRLLKNKLSLTESNFRFDDKHNWAYYDETKLSKNYPGLRTKLQRYFVSVVLLDDDREVLRRVGLPGKESAEESDTSSSGEGF